MRISQLERQQWIKLVPYTVASIVAQKGEQVNVYVQLPTTKIQQVN